MPKAAKKYYAVAVGRSGPHIYNTWDECKAQTTKFPAVFKSFPSLHQAEVWLAGKPPWLRREASLSTTESGQIDIRGRNPDVSDSLPPPSAGPSTIQASQVLDNESLVAHSSYTMPQAESLQIPMEDDHIPSTPKPIVTLSPEQQLVLDRVKRGRSVFFTGSAGTGKSVLLREIIDTLEALGHTVGVTASTGIAAVNIGGSTLHSWAGVGLADQPAQRYVGKFFGNKQSEKTLQRWQNVTTLVIDEVSMLDGTLFDKLEYIARGVRHSERPFGGVQLVLSGDFCQLPPVPSRDKHNQQIPSIFAFEAKTWDACVGPPVMLTRVFRQKDQDFADMLNAMRVGQMNDQITGAFSALSREVKYTDGFEPTQLYSTRGETDNANRYRLEQLKTEPHTYNSNDFPGTDSNGKPIPRDLMGRLLERLVVPKSIELKVGAQVMLVKNLIQGELVNGSLGQVVRFISARDAVSEGAQIPGTDRGDGKLKLPQEDCVWPVVRFISGRERVIIPEEFTVNNADGGMEARRDQVPLILSWALSIHKSQGQTLERVKVDLKRIFEKGQAYVALSRATRMDQLQVLNFDPSKVTAHPRVLGWYSRQQPISHNEVIELSGSDDDTIVRRTHDMADIIDLTDDDDEFDEDLAMS